MARKNKITLSVDVGLGQAKEPEKKKIMPPSLIPVHVGQETPARAKEKEERKKKMSGQVKR